MSKFFFGFYLLVLSSSSFAAPVPVASSGWAGVRPKLVVVMVIDQFRADYLSRFQKEFGKDGFRALMREGAHFPTAEYDIMQSMTAPGHATILSGAYPYQMGIPINDWYSQSKGEMEYCVEDAGVKTIGIDKSGKPSSSPKNFQGSTVGDELKNVEAASRVVSVAIKDRAAVLLGGKRADLAIWNVKGSWVTSTYYRRDEKLPSWLVNLNKTTPAKDQCDWGKSCGVEQTVRIAKAALVGENLGKGPSTDILAVSFSSHDMSGHAVGPNDSLMRTMTLTEDKAVAEIRAAVAKQVPGGLKNVVFVLTGDHGVAPTPEFAKQGGLDAGRIDAAALDKKINTELTEKFGKPKKGEWMPMSGDFNFYIGEENARLSKVKIVDLENAIKAIVQREPGFAQVLTRTEWETRTLPPGVFERRAMKTYYPGRSGHVIALVKPFYIDGVNDHTANHMTGYTYDRMVPLVISGFGIKPGLYAQKAEVVDIAPTLAFILGVLPPALSEGRVLHEALK